MPAATTRIFSDLHYGDRASRAGSLAQLAPLVNGIDALVLNGDTLDTRPGPNPEHTRACQAGVRSFAASHAVPITFLSGNHDADFSTRHAATLAAGRVVVTHGDIVFDDIVPWGRDAPRIRERIAAALAALPASARDDLDQRFAIWRSVAASISQRHQSERHGLKYALRFAADTIWPPVRIGRILRAWREHPALLGAFAQRHWPGARFIVAGHTHRPGITRLPDGRIVINTGSFCPPLGGCAVDVTPTAVRVRRIEWRNGEFRLAERATEFPL